MTIGPDRIQVLKQESASNGGDGADDVPYTTAIEPQEDALEAAGLYLQDASNRDEAVYIERAGADLRLVDVTNPSGFSLAQLATGGSGITEGQHTALDTLVHDIAEDNYTEITRVSGQVSAVTIWTSVAKTIKIREVLLTRSAGQVSTVVTNQFDAAGSLLSTLTRVIARTGGQVANITGTLT